MACIVNDAPLITVEVLIVESLAPNALYSAAPFKKNPIVDNGVVTTSLTDGHPFLPFSQLFCVLESFVNVTLAYTIFAWLGLVSFVAIVVILLLAIQSTPHAFGWYVTILFKYIFNTVGLIFVDVIIQYPSYIVCSPVSVNVYGVSP